MTESTPIHEYSAADALRESEAAAAALRGSIDYPPGFVGQMAAVMAISSVVAGLIASDDPIVGAVSLVLVGVLLGLAVTASRRFDAHNGVRITGLRHSGRAAAGFLIAGVALNILVAYAADSTGAWWVGIAAAPVAAALGVLYLRRWLVAYRGAA